MENEKHVSPDKRAAGLGRIRVTNNGTSIIEYVKRIAPYVMGMFALRK